MSAGIYEIVNTVNGKRYIGSARDVSKRFKKHRWDLKNGTHHSQILQRAVNKYGIDTFVFRQFMTCRHDDLLKFEQRLMDVLRPEYNVCKVAGSRAGFRHPPEVIELMRERARNVSAETRRLRSESGKVRADMDQLRARCKELGKKMLGVKLSDVTRASMSASRAGMAPSLKTIEAGRAYWTGRPKSEAARAKISASLTGKTQSPETTAKRVAAVKETWRKKREAAGLAA